MVILRIALITLFSLCGSGVVFAIDVAKEFSAEAIQVIPGRSQYQAKMYVSKEAVRTDSKMNNIDVSEIMYPAKLTQVLLIPSDKVYLERKSEKASPAIVMLGADAKKPCDGRPDTKCNLIDRETLNGRKADKWEFITTVNGRTFRSLHWIDVERHMPLREFFPDGTVSELKMIGREKINGRETEKWSLRVSRADGQSMESTQWYDPELKIAIREEMPGGYVRELRNIKIGPQNKSLFEIPKDFHKVDQLPGKLVPQKGQPGIRHE